MTACPPPTACRTARSRRRPHPGTASPTRPTPTRRCPANRAWGARHPRARRRLAARRRDGRRGGARRMPQPSTRHRPRRSRRGRRSGARARCRRARGDPAPRPATCSRRTAADLLEVMASEAGKTLDQADPEVSEAIDFAHYYAERGRELDRVDGARARPRRRHRRHPAVELPGRDPGGIDPRRARRRLGRHHQAGSPGARAAAPSGRGAVGGGRPARRAARSSSSTSSALGERLVAIARVDQVILTGGVRDGRAVPRLPPGPAAARRDERQERDHRDPERRPRPRRQGRRQLGLRARRAEVLGGVPRHPRRLGRDARAASATQLVDAVALAARRHCRPTRRLRSGPSSSPPSGKLLRGPHDARRGRVVAASSRARARRRPERGCGPRASATASRRGLRVPPDGVLRPGPRHHDAPRRSTRPSRSQNEVDYGLTAGLHSLDAGRGAHVARPRGGGQPLRQPRHHRRDRAAPAVRRLEEVRRRRRLQGRRAELPRGPRSLDRRRAGSGCCRPPAPRASMRS